MVELVFGIGGFGGVVVGVGVVVCDVVGGGLYDVEG